MKRNLIFSTILIAQITMAQQPFLPSKPGQQNAKSTPAQTQRPPKMLSELKGINQAWLKDLQQRTREYWLNRTNVSLPKDSVVVQQSSPAKNEVLSKATATVPPAPVVRDIPFASKNNAIELNVQNTSSMNAYSIDVEVTNAPSWLIFTPKTFHVGEMAGKEEKITTLAFSVDKFAPIGQEQSLTVMVKSSTGQSWSKEIKLKVSPPEKFEFYQNYPNPFNPTTTISYQLSANSKVNLKIYDILGREILTLADGEQQAGYHQEVFDAGRLASGVYIYRMVYGDASGKRQIAQKRMVLVK